MTRFYNKRKRPYRARGRRRALRPRGRKRFGRNGRVVPVKIRGLPSAFPPSIIVKLRYQTTVRLNGAFGVDHQMNMNSLFDPDRTGVGHQPYGFDQWALFYNRYRVYGFKYAITFINDSSTVVSRVGILPSNDTTNYALSNVAFEQPTSKYAMIGFDTSSYCRSLQRGYIPLTKIYGVTKVQLKCDDRFAADTASSPAELAIFHVIAQDYTLSSNIDVAVNIDIVYYVQMFDWNPFSQS